MTRLGILQARLAGALACALAIAGCTTQGPGGSTTLPGQTYAPSVMPDQIVGRWGLASYHRDADRERTVKAARTQCKQAYVINRGSTGGVMMHLADKKEPDELVTKGAAGGKTFIGPAGDAGGELDREIMSFDTKVMVLRWVDEEVAGRYGTMVYARCEARR